MMENLGAHDHQFTGPRWNIIIKIKNEVRVIKPPDVLEQQTNEHQEDTFPESVSEQHHSNSVDQRCSNKNQICHKLAQKKTVITMVRTPQAVK